MTSPPGGYPGLDPERGQHHGRVDAVRADAVWAELQRHALRARKVSGRPKRCKLAHTFPWEYSYKRLKLAQLLGQLGFFLTLVR
jgi:hypothetical protein